MHSKRKAFVDLSNISSDETSCKSFKYTPAQDMLPQDEGKHRCKTIWCRSLSECPSFVAWYKYDRNNLSMSYDAFMHLIDPKNDAEMITFLTDIGIIASSNTCLNCGGSMRKVKEGIH